MIDRKISIIVVGFGAMGCRHAQSLLDSGFSNITVVEPVYGMFEENMRKIGYPKEKIKYLSEISPNIGEYDFAIIATSSKPRYGIVKQLISLGVKNFLVEKIVFQSISQFDSILELAKTYDCRIYCNFVNRYYENYINIKKEICPSSKISMNVNAGNLGFGCNAIHYMDLFEYITNDKITKSSSALSKSLEKHKRGSEYLEFAGAFFGTNSRGDTISIVFDESHKGPVSINIRDDEHHFVLLEGSSTEVSYKDDQIVLCSFSMLPTSKLTSQLMIDILSNSSLLTTLEEAKNTHTHVFKACLNSIGEVFDKELLCPIT